MFMPHQKRCVCILQTLRGTHTTRAADQKRLGPPAAFMFPLWSWIPGDPDLGTGRPLRICFKFSNHKRSGKVDAKAPFWNLSWSRFRSSASRLYDALLQITLGSRSDFDTEASSV